MKIKYTSLLKMSDDNLELEEIRRKKFEEYMNIRSMPEHVLNLNTPGDFKEVKEKYPNRVIIIDFWAEWCAPCMSFAPVFERLQKEYSKDFIFAKVNVDTNPNLAQQYGITGIPTTLFLKNGKVLRKQVGLMNAQTMKTLLNKFKS
jgi:thioredoxin